MRARQPPVPARPHLPLNAFRSFEAGARRLSFTQAGEELGVSQGAISRQVKELEHYVGKALFHRMTRRLALTVAGEQLFKATEELFNGFEAATRSLIAQPANSVLTVSAPPTLTAVWLMPRLKAFTSAHQDVEIKILTSNDPADLLKTEADVAIRVGRLPGRHYDPSQPRIIKSMLHSWDGAQADELFPDRLVPVCSPRLLPDPIQSVEELLSYPLIHLTTRPTAWPDWFKAHNVCWAGTTTRDIKVSHFFMSIDAAEQGKGIALVPNILLAQTQSLAGLVSPYPGDVRSAGEYYLLIHETRLALPHVRDFRHWCLQEASALRCIGDAETVADLVGRCDIAALGFAAA